jgi:hypothetical protein
MIYYRTEKPRREVSIATIRIATASSLIAYPAGAMWLARGPDALMTSVTGYGLILLALLAYVPLAGSSLQRIVGENPKLLDEYELRLRGRAMSASYATFTGLVLLLTIYAAIASDKNFWVPVTYEQFNGLFWGLFLYASVLPTGLLSWMVEPDFTREQE